MQLADKSGDAFERMSDRAALADALHQAGELAAARESFVEAEKLQQEMQAGYPQLYSLQGFRYCDLLLAMGEWEEVLERVGKTLEWVTNASQDILSPSLDKLSLGRACLQQTIVEAGKDVKPVKCDEPQVKSTIIAPDCFLLKVDFAKGPSTLHPGVGESLQTAKEWLDQAVEGLRKAGEEEFVALSLLARAGYHRWSLSLGGSPDGGQQNSHYKAAEQDLQETRDIADRGAMRLHLTDYYLESARLALTINQPVFNLTASEHTAKAKQLIAETGYKRRLPEIEYLEKCLQNVVEFSKAAGCDEP